MNTWVSLTENAVSERIQRASLSDFDGISSAFSPFARALLTELFWVHEQTRIIDEHFDVVHDRHGCWTGGLHNCEHARQRQ